MEETIIIYTKYYSEAVIEILDTYDLNVQVMCFSTYDQVLHYTKITPNLRGIIFLEHRPRRSAFKAYRTILTTADEVAESIKQPLCVSIISNNDLPRKFISQINTKHIEVYFTKFIMLNTDLLRFEGLATVIMNTIGAANETILLELENENGSLISRGGSDKTDFQKYCLQIVTMDYDKLKDTNHMVERFPSLAQLIYLRQHDDKDQDILNSNEGLFRVFALQCIKRREEDEKKTSFLY